MRKTEATDVSQEDRPGRWGVDDEAIRAAEERRRSKSNSGTLEGDAFRVDRITQVKELEAVITGLTGGERSTYEKQDEYERRIAGMREAATEAKMENTRAEYWQGVELWDTQKAMSGVHTWPPLEAYRAVLSEE